MLITAAVLAVLTVAGILLATGALGGDTVSWMSLPQKVTAGTSAYCQTMAQAPGATPGLIYDEQYIVSPANLPLSGTRLEADIQAARSANGNDQARFLTAVKNVLADCQYILARAP